MIGRRMRTAAILVTLLMISGSTSAVNAQPPPPPGEPPPAPPGEAPAGQAAGVTPPRLGYINGEVSFWRPGAEDWTPAQINTPLSPGDSLYAGGNGSAEVQVGTRAFARAGNDTQLGLANVEPGFTQIEISAGHASLDLRSLEAGQTFELDTPNAAFTIETSGYYRVDVTADTTTLITRRGGRATAVPAGGDALTVEPSEEVVVQGTENPKVGMYVAPEMDAWDRWNSDRTDHLIEATSARYVPAGVYGIDTLDQYGTWRATPDYGSVWVPRVAAGWVPYSTGKWVWDPFYGWTWVDDAPWGWAPSHYGRWVHQSGYWGWAPGPIVAAPVYAPALVAFIGGANFGVSIGIGAPAVGWVALGWGEPLVPWWGHRGFIGEPWWGGWGGPRVVNNVVINRTTIVNVRNINVYRNMRVQNAVIATPQSGFGRGGQHVRVREVNTRQVEFLHGRVPVRPAPVSLAPRTGRGIAPPEAMRQRRVVALRAPRDTAAALQTEGLKVPTGHRPAPQIIAHPSTPHAVKPAPRAPGQPGTAERGRPPQPPQAPSRERAPSQAPAQRQKQPAPRPQAGAPPAGKAPAPSRERAPNQAPVQRQKQPAPRPPAGASPAGRAPAPPPPRERAPQAPPAVPRGAAPAGRPAPQRGAQEPPPVQHAPAQAPPQTRNAPGEPANRNYRRPAQPHAPHAPAPAKAQRAPSRESGKPNPGERKEQQ